MPSGNSQNIINSLNTQSSTVGQYKQDQSGVTLPDKIEVTTIAQNANGDWVETIENVENPYKSTNTIRSEITNEMTEQISNYFAMCIPYDNDISILTQRINQKKQEIVSLVSSAVSFGCSAIYPTASPLTVSGSQLGYGQTVYKDTATISVYDYQKDTITNDPFNSVNSDIAVTGQSTTLFVSLADRVGNIRQGSKVITGISTEGVTVNLRVEEIDGLISAGTSVSAIGINSITMSVAGIGSTNSQTVRFGYLATTLNSYIGKGYKTNTGNSNGSLMGTYATIPTDPNVHFLCTSVLNPVLHLCTEEGKTVGDQLVCAGYGSSILAIASELVNLRAQLSPLVGPVNQIKDLKKGIELQYWGDLVTDATIAELPSTNNDIISQLNNF